MSQRKEISESGFCWNLYGKALPFISQLLVPQTLGFLCVSDGKESAYNAWDPDQEDPLEKGMETHSSILVWRTPWTEKPGRLQSMGSQTVRHNWATNTHTHTHTHIPNIPWLMAANTGRYKVGVNRCPDCYAKHSV